jgi:hypothetical protein
MDLDGDEVLEFGGVGGLPGAGDGKVRGRVGRRADEAP